MPIPRRTAAEQVRGEGTRDARLRMSVGEATALAHFLVINKGARQFCLNSAARWCTMQNTFFLNLKQRTVVKAVEDVLRYIKMYVVGVSVNTERGYFKNVEEQVIRLQSKV